MSEPLRGQGVAKSFRCESMPGGEVFEEWLQGVLRTAPEFLPGLLKMAEEYVEIPYST